jgi:carbonic anhydrase
VQKLIRGLHQFQNDYFLSHKEFFEQLSRGQKPETLFITCSDSRINPNLLTQTRPGELFILRNAGNLIPNGTFSSGEAATIEYAIAGLGVRDIVICGHSHCGAMKALLRPRDMDRMPAVRDWLRHAEATRRIIEDNYGHLDEQAKLTATVEENVLVQLENLRTLPSVASALKSNRIHLHGWVYKIETGEVFAYSPEAGQFSRLGEKPALPVPLASSALETI